MSPEARCRNCRWWGPVLHACGKFDEDRADLERLARVVSTEGDGEFITGPDFGCTEFEVRA